MRHPAAALSVLLLLILVRCSHGCPAETLPNTLPDTLSDTTSGFQGAGYIVRKPFALLHLTDQDGSHLLFVVAGRVFFTLRYSEHADQFYVRNNTAGRSSKEIPISGSAVRTYLKVAARYLFPARSEPARPEEPEYDA